MKYFLYLLCCFTTVSLQAQNSESSGEIIKKAVALREDNRLKESIDLFKTVSVNDSNYYQSVYELGYSYYIDSQYLPARKYFEMGLQASNGYIHQFMNQYGMVLDKLGETEKGFAILDSAIRKYPDYTAPYINKSNILIRIDSFREAEQLLQQALVRFPYAGAAHYNLGLAALNQGKMIQAYMSFTMALLVDPDASYRVNCTGLMSRIAKGDKDILAYMNNRREETDDNYQLVEQILVSKAVLDKSYELKTPLDDAITRQLQMIFEKLAFSDDSNDFWIQYYLPLYRDIYARKNMAELTNLMFSAVDIDQIKEYLKKNKKEIASFAAYCNNYLNGIRDTRQLSFKNRTPEHAIYHYENGVCIAKGKLDGEKPAGPWEFYYTLGQPKFRGAFNSQHNREGAWTFYHDNGLISEKEYYVNGNLQGEAYSYDKEGNLLTSSHYVNNLKEGDVLVYYANGAIQEKSSYTGGKENGAFTQFYRNGNIKMQLGTKDGKGDGIFLQYHESGTPLAKGQYAGGMMEGPFTFYHENGVVSMEGRFANDQKTGEWKNYHENGQLKSIENYVNGEVNGSYTEYYDNGKLFYQETRKKGRSDGETIYFNREGQKLSRTLSKNGLVKSVSYFDRQGNQVSSAEANSKGITVVSYRPDGSKNTETAYDEKGMAQGIETAYYGGGQVSGINNYSNGMLEGKATAYFLNGKTRSETEFSADQKNGPSKEYYPHGQLKSEGFYKDGKKSGEWKFYDERGTVLKITNYKEDEMDGVRFSYYPNGKMEEREFFREGILTGFVQYDSTGAEYNHADLPNGTGRYLQKHMSGQIMVDTWYEGGYINGPYTSYYGNGQVLTREFYRRGFPDSAYTMYLPDGTVYRKGSFRLGNKIGTWSYYNSEGTLYYTEKYEKGILVLKTYYHENGREETVIPYTNGVREGWVVKTADNGDLVYKARYFDELMQEYSYDDKNGNPVPPVVLKGATGKVITYFRNGNPSAGFDLSSGEYLGEVKLYHPNGKTYWQSTEQYGESEGPMKEYYSDGQPKTVYHYWHNCLQGPYKSFYPGGKIREEGNYDLDYKHGAWKKYDERGTLIRTDEYFYGNLVTTKK